MDCPVALRADDRGYTATSLYWPQVAVSARTRDEALRAAQAELAGQLASCEVVMVEVPGEDPWQDLIGKYARDDDLREIVREAYAERDRHLVQ
jgi:hypothetical protein